MLLVTWVDKTNDWEMDLEEYMQILKRSRIASITKLIQLLENESQVFIQPTQNTEIQTVRYRPRADDKLDQRRKMLTYSMMKQ